MKHQLMVVGPNLSGALQSKGQFHVHVAGCADLKRRPLGPFVAKDGSLMEVETLFEVVTDIYIPEEFDWDPTDAGDAATYWNDFHFAPCVKDIPTGFPEAGEEEAPEDEDEGISAEDLLAAAAHIESLDALLCRLGVNEINDMSNLAGRLRAASGEEQ